MAKTLIEKDSGYIEENTADELNVEYLRKKIKAEEELKLKLFKERQEHVMLSN